jgi:hypothetical protein
MAALANCRQKPGSAARASANPDIRNIDGKHTATNRSLFVSPLPRIAQIPLPKVASPTEVTKCCEPARGVLRLMFLACRNECSSYGNRECRMFHDCDASVGCRKCLQR